ncbi:MAG: hypothetical protein IIA66_05725 [Planctomycetes bacterium]|nr:hypothetical protein [Planctomycetota bacterium]
MAGDYQEAKATCHHEAGHIICGITRGVPIKRVSIAPACGKGKAGEATYAEVGDDFDMLVCTLGGSIAEERFTGRPNEYGAFGDRESVKRLLAKRYGRETKDADLDAPIVAAAKVEAAKIVTTRWVEIEALAARLIEKFEIEETEIRAIVGRAATDRITNQIAKLEKLT